MSYAVYMDLPQYHERCYFRKDTDGRWRLQDATLYESKEEAEKVAASLSVIWGSDTFVEEVK